MIDTQDPAVLKALEKALNDTFEGIAFSQVLDREVLSQAAQVPKGALGAFINMPDPLEVCFVMVLSQDHALSCFESVAADLDMANLPAQVLSDFVQELCNTAAGHFNSLLAPEKKDMTIGLPCQCEGEELQRRLKPDNTSVVVCFQVEDHPVFCSLRPIS